MKNLIVNPEFSGLQPIPFTAEGTGVTDAVFATGWTVSHLADSEENAVIVKANYGGVLDGVARVPGSPRWTLQLAFDNGGAAPASGDKGYIQAKIPHAVLRAIQSTHTL